MADAIFGGMAVGAGMDATSAYLSAKMDRRSQKRAIRFQREMAQNKYQYAVKDLIAAGINPIMAVRGMSGGTGGAGVGVPTSPRVSGYAQTAKQGAMATQEMANLRATEAATRAATKVSKAQEVKTALEANKVNVDAMVAAAQASNLQANTARTLAELPGLKAMEDFYRREPWARYYKEFGWLGGTVATGMTAKQRALSTGRDMWKRLTEPEKKLKKTTPQKGGGGSW